MDRSRRCLQAFRNTRAWGQNDKRLSIRRSNHSRREGVLHGQRHLHHGWIRLHRESPRWEDSPLPPRGRQGVLASARPQRTQPSATHTSHAGTPCELIFFLFERDVFTESYGSLLQLFKLLMTENPEAAERLVAVDGDFAAVGLGLSPTDRQTLIDNVSIVFHCAATVRFDLTADHMIMVNTRGTREVVKLCKELKKLEVSYLCYFTVFEGLCFLLSCSTYVCQAKRIDYVARHQALH